MRYIDLRKPEHSYFFGFAQSDGHLGWSSKNKAWKKGRLQIELGRKDLDLLKSFKKLFFEVCPSIRSMIRNTNFKEEYRSYSITICNMKFREEINKLGVPYGKKSSIVSPPIGEFCERDYIRGLVDGDGSVGVAAVEFPFISLTIKSEALKKYFLNILEKIVGEKKRLNRNKRDGIYNIMINREKAQKLIRYLYYPDCLALGRKLKSAKLALQWKRPEGMRRVICQKFWEDREDKYILSHSLKKSCDYLERTENSVGMRLWRLKNNKIKNYAKRKS